MDALHSELRRFKHVFVVCDRNVEAFARGIAPGRKLLPIEASESSKNMDTVMGICRWLLSEGADRDALVLAVGGGVTTDMAGFAASIYKRGVRYGAVPTTLLSQVDAGIGGKTGVNLDGFKNLLGTIRQPEFTAIFPEVLESLPEREIRSGAAEMLKTFVIKNPARAFERAADFFSGEFRVNDTLVSLIQEAAAIKQAIVDRDEFEGGLRRKLNLGHTWAHAIEWWQTEGPGAGRTDYAHGEAVAIGMVQAARLAEKLGIAQEAGLSPRIAEALAGCGLPTELPCPQEELLPAMLKDKKALDGRINLVLPVRIGKVIVKKTDSF